MSVTDGCNKDTSKPMGSNVRTLILTTDHLFAIEQGLENRVNDCKIAIDRRTDDDPDKMYWRDQLDNAEQALAIVQGAR